MRWHPATALLSIAALLLAGCATDTGNRTETTGPPAPQHEPDWAVRAIFAGSDPDATDRLPDHDHANRSLHRGLTTPNIDVLGFAPSHSPYLGTAPGNSLCGDVSAPGERQLALVHSHVGDVAFTVFDVTDRSHPMFLGELVLPFVFTYDLSVFPDGRYAVVAANPDVALDQMPSTGSGVPLKPIWRDACGNEEAANSTVSYVPYGYSTILVDLADPTAPQVVDFYPYANGRNVHSISTAVIDDKRFVATSGLQQLPCTMPGISGNPLPNPVPCQPVPRYGNLLSHYDFLTVEETAGGPKLTPYSVYVADGTREFDPDLLVLSNGHTDATLQKHPLTNDVIGYLANWDGGLITVRLDGPGKVTKLATWGQADPPANGDPTQMTGNIHTSRPVEGLRNGRHLTITGQEIIGNPAGRPTGQIVLLNTTNPALPTPLARWTSPVNFTWPPNWGLRFSTHYAILQDDVLFVANYHAGVWAVDAREENWPELPSLGVLIPDREPASAPLRPSDTPEVLEVLDNGDGTLTAFDADAGAYVFRFQRAHPDVPPALPYTKDAWIGR